jgi:hypothetical protein
MEAAAPEISPDLKDPWVRKGSVLVCPFTRSVAAWSCPLWIRCNTLGDALEVVPCKARAPAARPITTMTLNSRRVLNLFNPYSSRTADTHG